MVNFWKTNKNNRRSQKKHIDALKILKLKELKAIDEDKFDDNEKHVKYKEVFDEFF